MDGSTIQGTGTTTPLPTSVPASDTSPDQVLAFLNNWSTQLNNETLKNAYEQKQANQQQTTTTSRQAQNQGQLTKNEDENQLDQLCNNQAEATEISQNYQQLGASIQQFEQENPPSTLTPDQQAKLADLSSQVSEGQSTSRGLVESSSQALAAFISSPTGQKTIQQKTVDYQADGPKLTPPGNQSANSADKPNLFLAAGMITILMRVELGLIHQMIENKDMERMCKQLGFESVREFAHLAAQAAYNKDMDEANKLFAQAAVAIVNAVMSAVSFVSTVGMAAKMRGNVAQEREAMRDNPDYDNALFEKTPDKTGGRRDPATGKMAVDSEGRPTFVKGSKPLRYDLRDPKTGEPIKPGAKQIQDRADWLRTKANDTNDPRKSPTGGTTLSAADAKTARDKEADDLEANDLKQAQSQYNHFDEQSTYLQKLNSDPGYKSLDVLNNMFQGFVNGIGSAIQAGYQTDIAAQDANQIMAQTAMDTATKFLQSAMDDFSSETRGIQSIIDFIMEAQSKNTEWGNLRA